MGSVQTIINLGSALIKVPPNGYAYIYACNQSCNPVYIDNFQVVHEHGRILEENHYYAYGLKIAGISSRAFGAPKNPYQYQGDYSEFDEETGWNDFELRSYDAQTGRFMQQDPYGQFASGYMGMGNNPVNNVDEDGGWSVGFTGAIVGGVIGGVGGYLLAKKTGGKPGVALLAGIGGALVGAGLGYAGFESGFNSDAGSLGMEMRSFYDGLFTGGGHIINHAYDATNSFSSAAQVISPNLSIALFSTNDVIKISYVVAREFYLSSPAAQQPGDYPLTRRESTYLIQRGEQGPEGRSTMGGIGKKIIDVGSIPPMDTSNGEVKVKWRNAGTTGQTLMGSYIDPWFAGTGIPVQMGFDPSTGSFKVIQTVTSTTSQNNITGSRTEYTIKPQETRVRVSYYHRIDKYVRKKKFLFFTLEKYIMN